MKLSPRTSIDVDALRRLLLQLPEGHILAVLLLSRWDSIKPKVTALEGALDCQWSGRIEIHDLFRRLERVQLASEQLGCCLRRLATVAARTRYTEHPRKDLPPLLPTSLSFVERVERAIDAGIEDDRFDTAKLASDLAVSRAQLYRKLSEFNAPPPAKLILQRRLEQAAVLLESQLHSVTHVAFQVGFKSVSHFSRKFRDRFGLPPSSWSERNRDSARGSGNPATSEQTKETAKQDISAHYP